jgi:uncharacterized protein YjbJ (UPF0337 family)
MNWDQIEGKWQQLSGSVKAKWGDLTDDEITEISGYREKLEGKIQERYGRTREEARKEVDDWFSGHSLRPKVRTPTAEFPMNNIIYLVGLVVVILFILGLFGLR